MLFLVLLKIHPKILKQILATKTKICFYFNLASRFWTVKIQPLVTRYCNLYVKGYASILAICDNMKTLVGGKGDCLQQSRLGLSSLYHSRIKKSALTCYRSTVILISFQIYVVGSFSCISYLC